MTIQNFSMIPGNSKTIEVTIDDVDLSSGITIFQIFKDHSVILTKQDLTISGNIITLTLSSSDTQNLLGDYDYSFIFTDFYGNVTNLLDGTISFRKSNGLTAEQVFITAMDLMDEESQDGTYDGYPDEYKKKAWNILNILQAELTPANGTPSLITDKDSTFYVDDRTCLTVLPYGLAAHLLLTENTQAASFFNDRYEELKRKRPAIVTKIKDVYSGKEESGSNKTSVTTDNTSTNLDILDGGEW